MRLAGVNRQRAGIFLLEAMVYIAVLGMILGTVGAAYLSISRGATAVTKHTATLAAIERFREAISKDLARCEAIVPEAGEWQASKHLLLLKVGDGAYRAWGPGSEDQGIAHFDIPGDERTEPNHLLRHGNVEFEIQERDGRPIGMIVHVSLREHLERDRHPFSTFVSFSAFRETRR